MHITAFLNQTDLSDMCALIKRSRPRAGQSDYPAADDLRELLAEPVVQNSTRLWRDANNQLAAYALVDESGNLAFDVLPAAQNSILDDAIFTWGVQCLQQRPCTQTPLVLDSACRTDDAARIAWLERFGFVRQTIETIHMRRSLHAPLSSPHVPDGFAIRAVTSEQEAEALAALHRAAFGTDYMTAEKRLVWMRAAHYDPALDLVVTAPNGELAAYCFGKIDPDEIARTGTAEGHLDPLATHPQYQGRGLARALLAHGLNLLRARGMEWCSLGTSSENTAMQRAACAAGFFIESKRAWFSKTL